MWLNEKIKKVLSKMEKYQVALLMNIRKQLQEWFEKSQPVQYQDVKRFLHSLAGTSQTIGLEYLGKVSAELLDGISENPQSTWDTKELQILLIDIIKICYKDEGIGIPEEAINKLFTKFYRVDNSDMRKIGGTGLGLSIVKEIVKSHQGEIKVNSEWKKGSTFTISLPLMTTHSVEQIEQEKEDGKRSIIIIEDDKSLASLLQVELKESGFYVRHFDRGEAAIEAIQANPPEAIVLDIMLHEHEMNEWDILKTLKGDPTTEHIPIFISSALDEKNKGMEFGAYAYLVKPYQPSKLTNTILQMIVEKNEGNGEILVPRSDTE
ncbi:response regulator [Priestia flexa]|nr:response regulator [Priestia flexa]